MLVARVLGMLCVFLVASAEHLLGQGPPIRGEGGGVQFFQGNVFRTWAEWNQTEASTGEGSMRVLTYTQLVALSYVASPGLAIRVQVPVVSKHFQAGPWSALPDSITGLGDTAVSGKYRFFFRPGDGTRIDTSVVGGGKLPTGASDRVDGSGKRFPRPMQLGTGSIDFFWKLAASYADGPKGYSVFANLVQTLTQESDGYEFGNRWDIVFGLRKRFLPMSFDRSGNSEFYGELALLYGDREQDLEDDQVVLNSGRRSFALAPGVTYILQSTYLFEFSTRIPLSQSFSGNQMEESWNVGLGFRIVY